MISRLERCLFRDTPIYAVSHWSSILFQVAPTQAPSAGQTLLGAAHVDQNAGTMTTPTMQFSSIGGPRMQHAGNPKCVSFVFFFLFQNTFLHLFHFWIRYWLPKKNKPYVEMFLVVRT